MVSDGVEARIGTLTPGANGSCPGGPSPAEALAGPHLPQLQVVLEGVFEQAAVSGTVRDFIVFEDDGGKPRQEDGGLPPVPRCEGRRGRNAARRGAWVPTPC